MFDEIAKYWPGFVAGGVPTAMFTVAKWWLARRDENKKESDQFRAEERKAEADARKETLQGVRDDAERCHHRLAECESEGDELRKTISLLRREKDEWYVERENLMRTARHALRERDKQRDWHNRFIEVLAGNGVHLENLILPEDFKLD